MLLNVTYHGDLCRAIADEEDSADLLVDVLQMFRDIGPVFCLAAETLCRLIESHKGLQDEVSNVIFIFSFFFLSVVDIQFHIIYFIFTSIYLILYILSFINDVYFCG